MSELQALFERPVVAQILGLGLLFSAAALAYGIARWVVVAGIRRLIARSAVTWDDHLVDNKLFIRLAHIAPALVIYYGVALVPDLHDTMDTILQRVAVSTMILVVSLSLGALLSAANEIYSSDVERRQRPIKGYVQVVKIVVYLVATLLIASALLDRSPWIFLTGLGAMAAVLLLIFRDTILGLVASVQLTGNDMVHVGDWIEMPQYGADGDVIDVALHTVKVQNWDKTITTIPTYKLIEGSFKNWRGMSRSGGRRIKRSVFIDVSSIRFLHEGEVEKFGRFELLRDYVTRKGEEIAAHNAEPGRDVAINADIRRLTNVGTFRAYVLAYLRSHPKVHERMTLLVRQLALGSEGLPIEIYCFTNDTNWGRYEEIQADIFDHLLAVLPDFGLRAFQSPSGADLARIAGPS
ncbi:MAG: mechanosensitive ion channel [Proteobacteria bacterium]|nr:mechanosensitive ion channel [Pseudomonadota bacterium]